MCERQVPVSIFARVELNLQEKNEGKNLLVTIPFTSQSSTGNCSLVPGRLAIHQLERRDVAHESEVFVFVRILFSCKYKYIV